MDVKYCNDGVKDYIVCRYTDNDDIIDKIGVEMLSGNKIKGLICPVFIQTDDESQIRFDVTGKLCLREFIDKKTFDKRSVLDMLGGMLDVLIGVGVYLLDADMILLNEDYIFVDDKTERIQMLCIPTKNNKNDTAKIADFFKNVVFNLHPQKSENSFYYSELITFLSNREKFTLCEFRKLIMRLGNEHKTEDTSEYMLAESSESIDIIQDNSILDENFVSDVHSGKVNVFIPDANVILNTGAHFKKRNMLKMRLPAAMTNIMYNILNK